MTNVKPSTTRRDCFAHSEPLILKGGEAVAGEECTALDKLYCKKGDCGFYKSRFTQLRELTKYNGTPSLDEAVQNYALARKARGLPN